MIVLVVSVKLLPDVKHQLDVLAQDYVVYFTSVGRTGQMLENYLYRVLQKTMVSSNTGVCSKRPLVPYSSLTSNVFPYVYLFVVLWDDITK